MLIPKEPGAPPTRAPELLQVIVHGVYRCTVGTCDQHTSMVCRRCHSRTCARRSCGQMILGGWFCRVCEPADFEGEGVAR